MKVTNDGNYIVAAGDDQQEPWNQHPHNTNTLIETRWFQWFY
jgi:hypothetical protein